MSEPQSLAANVLAWANLVLIALNILVWLAARLWWLGELKQEVRSLRASQAEALEDQRAQEERLTKTREEFQQRLAETREEFIKALTGIDSRLQGLIQQSDAKRLAAALQAAMQQNREARRRRTKVSGPNRRRKR